MNRQQKSLVILVSATMVVLVVTAATVTAWTANTPLYMVRMEQASSEMNFLPKTVNGFNYTTEQDYTLNCNIGRYCNNMGITEDTWNETCDCLTEPSVTCPGTCDSTCPYTCDDDTCLSTCPATCNTCATACYSTCNTCMPTCIGTCRSTCPATCKYC